MLRHYLYFQKPEACLASLQLLQNIMKLSHVLTHFKITLLCSGECFMIGI